MMRLIQITHPERGRRIAKIDGGRCLLIQNHTTLYGLATSALRPGDSLTAEVEKNLSGESLDYDAVYSGQSDWRLLPAFDHPEEPARCLVAGTGLTHKASARSRQAMHGGQKDQEAPVTDSMRMYQWGVEGGRPEPGALGVQPEWFYKGCGTVLRALASYVTAADLGSAAGPMLGWMTQQMHLPTGWIFIIGGGFYALACVASLRTFRS